jgi:hypothetical protein
MEIHDHSLCRTRHWYLLWVTDQKGTTATTLYGDFKSEADLERSYLITIEHEYPVRLPKVKIIDLGILDDCQAQEACEKAANMPLDDVLSAADYSE